MSHIQPKKVTIISGFLGAGKTTFLNELLIKRKGVRHLVIENEFGKEGIDAQLVIAPERDVFELNSGCLCCDLSEDLYDLLHSLWDRKSEFDELVIETTGIADPAKVAQPFLVLPQIKQYYSLARVICLVDARLIRFQIKDTEDAVRQIAFADIILINKTEDISSGYLQELQLLLGQINPCAAILSGNQQSGYPIDRILDLKRNDFDTKILPGKDAVCNLNPANMHKHVAGEHHHKGISSLTFVFDRPFNFEAFYYRLVLLLNMNATEIYRVKGILWATEEPDKIILQSVSNILAITPGRRWEQQGQRASKLVFIGKDLKSKGLADFLRHCLDG